MEYSLENIRLMPRCAQCGKEIISGRVDRKFCSEACKNEYHNRRRYPVRRRYDTLVLQTLDSNRTILYRLWKMGVSTIDLVTLFHLGFDPHYITCYHRQGRHNVFAVFDMQYEMTPSRMKKLCCLSQE